MRRIISFFMIVAMLVSIATINTSAAGQILFQDTFDAQNEAYWKYDVTYFYVENGWCKADNTGAVLQSEYSGTQKWGQCAVSVDIALYDYDSDLGDHNVGLWWKDYQRDVGEEDLELEDVENGITYLLEILPDARRVELSAENSLSSAKTEEESTEDPNGPEIADDVIMYYELPEDYEIKIDSSEPTIMNLGMRIQDKSISAYLDGKLLFTYTAENTLFAVRETPICLLNLGDMMVGFDNFTVATPDYPLFADDLVATPAPEATDGAGNDSPTPVPDIPKETEIKEVIVTDTDDSGNIVTKVDTEIVTVVPPADTNIGGTVGGTGAQTGDMAVIVIAVMVVALGTAIVVKKVNVK